MDLDSYVKRLIILLLQVYPQVPGVQPTVAPSSQQLGSNAPAPQQQHQQPQPPDYGRPPQQLVPGALLSQQLAGPAQPAATPPAAATHGSAVASPGDLLSPASTISAYATPTALTPLADQSGKPFPAGDSAVNMSGGALPPVSSLQVVQPTVNRPQVCCLSCHPKTL